MNGMEREEEWKFRLPLSDCIDSRRAPTLAARKKNRSFQGSRPLPSQISLERVRNWQTGRREHIGQFLNMEHGWRGATGDFYLIVIFQERLHTYFPDFGRRWKRLTAGG